MDHNDFHGKVVGITVGAQGIGLCLVDTFAQRGASVAFCDVNVKSGRHWERKYNDEGMDVFFVQADLGREVDARKFARAALEKYERADALINNVGITSFGRPFLGRPLREWNRMISVNLTSHFLCSQLFAPGADQIQRVYRQHRLHARLDERTGHRALHGFAKGASSHSPIRSQSRLGPEVYA